MTATGTTRSTIPTAADLAALPVRARVAFAARCARRAVSLLRRHHGDAVPDAISKLDALVLDVERFAGGGEPETGLGVGLESAFTLAGDYAEHSIAPKTNEPLHAHTAVANTADILAYTLKVAMAERPEEAAKHAASAALQTRIVCGTGAFGGDDMPAHREAARLIRGDFDKLVIAARRFSWCDGVSVAAAWFGPLEDGSIDLRDAIEEG